MKDGKIHRCELLEYLGRHLEYVKDPHGYGSRWVLIVPRESTGGEQMVVLDYVLHCPCCGKDLRKKTGSGIVGRPQLEKLLAVLKDSRRGAKTTVLQNRRS